MFVYNYLFGSNENNNEKRLYGWKNQNVLKSTIPKECYIHIEHYNLDNVKYVDLRDNCPPIYDQGKLGSCTANAIAAAFEYDEIE